MAFIKITKAFQEDLKDILSLQKLAFRSEVDVYSDFETSPPLLQTLEEISRELPESIFLKAVVENEIVGSVRAHQVKETTFIKRLVVSPSYQNQDIGTKLMNSIEYHFKDNKRYELFTGHKSIRNLHLYRKLGYKEFKRIHIDENLIMIYLEKFVSHK
ncbi:MAG TPA: GNAT family N-acetyltransferase [Candidatus Saccharimonadales bacterium]|nr:GNAT family N-acetyltransferase [Candidatus Saccharimonadales bacterium]